MKETAEHNNRFYGEELKTENEQLKEWLIVANKENERLNNIINTILNFDFFKDECPLNFCYTEKCDEEEAQNVFYEDDYCEENCDDNNYKKCWLKYFKKLQELLNKHIKR